MLTNEGYIKQSLELNLYFLRIMKEHSLFMQVAFQPLNNDLIQEAKRFNNTFNALLQRTVELSKGVVEISPDIVTEFTLASEKATSALTGVTIDTSLTEEELRLSKQKLNRINDNILLENVRTLNNNSISTTKSLIRFKTKVLDNVLACKLYTANYPLLIDHIRREAILFVDSLNNLQEGKDATDLKNAIEQELFWNRIMQEHSEFIRGFLDPTEEQLIAVANNFSIQYKELNKKTMSALNNKMLINQVTKESLKLTKEIKNFKTQGTEGILNCNIKSIIVPLLGDHVIRESTHFINILEKLK